MVLLGDVWETLRSRRPRAQAAELALVRAVHPEIAARFRGPRYHYIHGNHDLVGSVVDRAPDYWATTIGKTHLYFTHGHAYDWHWQRARWLGELGSWAGRVNPPMAATPLNSVQSGAPSTVARSCSSGMS